MRNFLRPCKWLTSGSSAGNVKKMAEALAVRSDGATHTVKTRVELCLRELRFDENTDFTPTAEDLCLCDDDFKSKFRSQRRHSIATVVRMLAALRAPA